MAKKDEQIEGQLDIFDFCTRPDYEVVQSNKLISGKQTLSLNSAKLLRSAIMQIKPEDEDFKAYTISIPELAKMFGIDRSDLHRDIKGIASELMSSPLYLSAGSEETEKWIAYSWVSYCGFEPERGLIIKLNSDLKPLLIQLKENYTQYYLESILRMRSVFSIRIFELMQSKIYEKTIPKKGVDVTLSVEEIRQACDIVEKFKAYTSFKNKVILVALKEIHEKTFYDVTYLELYKKRKIVAFTFHVTMNYMKNLH